MEKGELDKALSMSREGSTLIFKAKQIQILYQKNQKEEAKAAIASINNS